MKLVIDRQKWLRGEGTEKSYLLRSEDGKMCCIGFYSLACGMNKNDIIEITAIDEAREKGRIVPEQMEWLAKRTSPTSVISTTDANYLMAINDDPDYTDSYREQRITKEFATHGVEVEFIN